MPFKLSKAARQDLREILRYTRERWGLDQYQKYRTLLANGFEFIAQDPFSYKTRDINFGIFYCRSYRVGRHIIFYLPGDGSVEILRILHERMDFPSHFSDN